MSLTTYRTKRPESKVKMVINKWMTDLCLVSLKHICGFDLTLVFFCVVQQNQCCTWMERDTLTRLWDTECDMFVAWSLIKNICSLYMLSFNKVYILFTPCSVYTLITWWPGSVTLFLHFFKSQLYLKTLTPGWKAMWIYNFWTLLHVSWPRVFMHDFTLFYFLYSPMPLICTEVFL